MVEKKKTVPLTRYYNKQLLLLSVSPVECYFRSRRTAYAPHHKTQRAAIKTEWGGGGKKISPRFLTRAPFGSSPNISTYTNTSIILYFEVIFFDSRARRLPNGFYVIITTTTLLYARATRVYKYYVTKDIKRFSPFMILSGSIINKLLLLLFILSRSWNKI